MNKKHITLIILAIFLFSTISISVSAQLLDSLFDRVNEFFESGWQRYDALLSFFSIFILLFSASYAGLKKAFVGDDKTRSRPAIGIALAFAGISAAGIVSVFGFRIEKYGHIFIWFLLIILVFIIYALLLKLGLEKHKLLAFLIALIIVAILALLAARYFEYRGIGWRGFGFGDVSGPSISGIKTPEWLKNLFAKKEGKVVIQPGKAPTGPQQGQVEGKAVFWNGAWRDPGYVREIDGKMWNGKEWVCPEGTKWDEKQKKCVPEGKKPPEGDGLPWWVWVLIVLGGMLLLSGAGFGVHSLRRRWKEKKKPEEEILEKEIEKPAEPISAEQVISSEKIEKVKEAKNGVINKIDKVEEKRTREFSKILKRLNKKIRKAPWLKDPESIPFLPDKDSKEYKNLEKTDKELLEFLEHARALEKDIYELKKIEDDVLKWNAVGKVKYKENKNMLDSLESEENVCKYIKKLCVNFFNLEKEEEKITNQLEEEFSNKDIEQRLKEKWRKDVITNENKLKEFFEKEEAIYTKLKEKINDQNTILDQIKGKIVEIKTKEDEYNTLITNATNLKNKEEYDEALALLNEALGKYPKESEEHKKIKEEIEQIEKIKKAVDEIIEKFDKKFNEVIEKRTQARGNTQ